MPLRVGAEEALAGGGSLDGLLGAAGDLDGDGLDIAGAKLDETIADRDDPAVAAATTGGHDEKDGRDAECNGDEQPADDGTGGHGPSLREAQEDVRLGMSANHRPVIGIAPDVTEPRPGSVRAVCPLSYAEAVSKAGGWPVVLLPIVELIPEHLERCDGFVLTGGDDPRMEAFGGKTHPKATPVHPVRQAFDTALLRALMERRESPTLGVCLGMQMMALVAGGSMDQHLPDTLQSADGHWNNAKHPVELWGQSGVVTSHHRQAVRDAGTLRVVAMSEDGVVEAVDRPDCPFFLGVQWHPERTDDEKLGAGVFEKLIEAARTRRGTQ